MAVQKLQLIGNVGEDAKVFKIEHTEKYAISFSLATTERWKDKNGEKQSKTTWFKCVQYSKSNAIAPYIKKGTMLAIEGLPSASAYIDKEGNARFNLECIVKDLDFLGSNSKTSQQPADPSGLPPSVSGDFKDDDDLPF